MSARRVAAQTSTEPVIRIQPPVANSISTVPAWSGDGAGRGKATVSRVGATATGLNATGASVRLQSCCRHVHSTSGPLDLAAAAKFFVVPLQSAGSGVLALMKRIGVTARSS